MGTSIADLRNTLVVAPDTGPIEGVGQALKSVGSIDEWNVLLVAYGSDHERLRRDWHDQIADSPANFGTINVAGDTGVNRPTEPVSAAGRDITVSIPKATNIVELGITISLYLDNWEAGRTLVCFHSLDRLLAHADPEAAFRFLHVLTNRITGTDAVGWFSLDPVAVDERTIRTFEPIFDNVSNIEPDEPKEIPADVAFDVLRSSRRRYVLHSLREHPAPTTISALTSRVARYEPEIDPDSIEISLQHSHLPKLENAGLISTDGARITRRPAIEALTSYLELVSEEDLAD